MKPSHSRRIMPMRASIGIVGICALVSACSGSSSVTPASSASGSNGATNPNAPTPPAVPSTFAGVAVPWQVWSPTTPATPPSSTGRTFYVNGATGRDGNSGLGMASAFATIQKAASMAQAGDTVLIGAGLYHDTINMTNLASGQPGRPITFGAFGDGPVIIDGSTPVSGWTQVSGSVWKAAIAFTPIAVVLNNVPLRPAGGVVTAGSGTWAYSAGTLTVDFGGSTPSQADVIVPSDNGAQQVVFFYDNDYLVFDGLTVRGSGASGIWGYGNNITVRHCILEFNGKAGINFMSHATGTPKAADSVLYSRVDNNVLLNWPRGNNGFAAAGGGWSGGLAFSGVEGGVARGNVVYANGGEGIISYGSGAGHTLFEQNVAFDNWSVNMYFDNQIGDIARQNILLNHPMDTNTWLKPPSAGAPWDQLYKFSVCLMLADEYGSSNGPATLSGSQVYNNLMAGCRIGVRDYSEGALTTPHGLKDTLIANNTIILPPTAPPNTYATGIYLQDNGAANSNSLIENNLVYAFDGTESVFQIEGGGPIAGVTVDANAYFDPGTSTPFQINANTSATNLSFAQWRSTIGADAHGLFTDPMLVAVNLFQATGATPYDYRNAAPVAGSPLLGAGIAQSAFTTNLTGATRSAWNIGAF